MQLVFTSWKEFMVKRLAILLVCVFSACSPCQAAIVYSIDMDPLTAGIQNDVSVNAGDLVTAEIVLELTGSTSLANYSVTLGFDTSELIYVNGSESPPAPLISFLPLDAITPGEINGIEAGVLVGNGPVGPMSFVIATVTFQAVSPSGNQGDIDLTLFEDGIFDGSFGNDNSALAPTFNGGSVSVVPEPTGLCLSACMLLAAASIRRRPARPLA
jgi:hypothetical protein